MRASLGPLNSYIRFKCCDEEMPLRASRVFAVKKGHDIAAELPGNFHPKSVVTAKIPLVFNLICSIAALRKPIP